MKHALMIFLLCSLLSCQGSEDDLTYLGSRSESFSAEERQALFPNKLFIALVDQQHSERDLQKIIDQTGHYLLSLNGNQDTPLAVAIKFYNLKGALFIAKQLSPEHYLHQNPQGEGYIYLASQKGYVSLIKLLADRFYRSDELFSDYEFSDLDMKTHEGERALHVAKNYMVAEALKHEYWRGSVEFPIRKFQYLQNNKGQSFLHTAVRDQNSDLLRWGVKQSCVSKEEWEEQAFYHRYSSLFWRAVQTYGKYVWLDWDDLVNTQDNEEMTAINFSATNMFTDGIRILSSCQWTDYLLPDNKGNIPIQNFLLALDPLKPKHGPEVYETFTLLMEKQTRLKWFVISDHINSPNKKGDSSLHIAARLADPFFYDRLKKYGDIEQENHKEQTPREIFKSKRNQLKHKDVLN